MSEQERMIILSCSEQFSFNLLVQPAFHSKLINYQTEIVRWNFANFLNSCLKAAYNVETLLKTKFLGKLRTRISWKETEAECNIGLMQKAVSQLL